MASFGRTQPCGTQPAHGCARQQADDQVRDNDCDERFDQRQFAECFRDGIYVDIAVMTVGGRVFLIGHGHEVEAVLVVR